MFKIKVIRQGKPLKSVIRDSKIKGDLTKRELDKLGYMTLEHMINLINANSKEPTSNKGLRKSIKLEKFPKGGWGIGRIKDLPNYWKSVNWGHSGYSIHAKNAKFLRFKDENGKWIYRKVVHNHAITPMNYIEKTVFYFRNSIKSIMSKLKRK